MNGFDLLRQHERLFWKPAGERLFAEGEQPDGVWLLHSGKVDLLYSNPRGGAKPLRTLEAPHTLCVSETLGGRALDCSAMTQTPSLIGFIQKETLLRLLIDDPHSRIAVLQTQSDELNACYDCIRMIGLSRSATASHPVA